MEPLSWALWELVRGMSALDTHLASAQLQIFARGLVSWMDQYDVVVTPALAEAPVALDDVHWQTDDPMGLFTRSGAFTPFTAVANVTGQPAIALPLAESKYLPSVHAHLHRYVFRALFSSVRQICSSGRVLLSTLLQLFFQPLSSFKQSRLYSVLIQP